MSEVTIIKYANRRLYHPELRRYTTLPEVVEEIRSKRRVRVVEHITERDITREVLLTAFVASENSSENPQLSVEQLTQFLERAPARSGSTASSARQEAGVREPESRQP